MTKITDHDTWAYLPALSRKARLRLLSLMASRPTLVLGPVLSPPCNLQRPFRARSAWAVGTFHTRLLAKEPQGYFVFPSHHQSP